MAKLEAGAQAPTFTLPDQDGNPVSLDDFKGSKVLVYFYPADDTPGCTKEACQFNDNLAGFQAAGVPVIGFIAHMDTSPAVSGENVNPIFHKNYQGGDIRRALCVSAEFFPADLGREATIGSPDAIASISAFGDASVRDGSTKRSAAARRRAGRTSTGSTRTSLSTPARAARRS
mgnify:CR=1 FL=1